MSETLNIVRLQDYQAPAFTITHHELTFQIFADTVLVIHEQKFSRCQPKTDENGWEIPQEKDVVLNAEQLTLNRIELDGKSLSEKLYHYDGKTLTLKKVPDTFTLTTEVELEPEKNKELSGLYRSSGIFCTQCEAEGFRRISPTLDRPDVLATYRVRIEAEKDKNPVLLSNGNLELQGELPNGRHYAQWFDPHPKPCYLFALVAGDLASVSRRITSKKGKKIDLRIYTEPAFIEQTDHAMQSLIESINWDETRFGLSYDLDLFNIVAIRDFNMGAMENKSLNIFNIKYVLGDVETATDDDFHGIQSVIGHEYFHNWTGNRITCRDWFQLSLKEGLTVFRDQEFSSDLNERSLERIKNVNVLRRVQFVEDKGPMRHPVQPQEYASIDNFYTATVYEKGAEIIRMYHTILGEKGFQEGMKRYISRHDGQAVRIEDFAQAMSDGGEFDFTGAFFHWYTTIGTPELTFTTSYNQHERRLTIGAGQDINAVSPPHPLVIPIRLSLLYPNGRLYRFSDGSYEQLLILDKARGSWTFEKAAPELIPVLMQNFSAPVYYHHRYEDHELATIIAHAPDGFARFEAMQTRYRRLFERALKQPETLREDSKQVAEIMEGILQHDKRSAGEKALLLTFPELATLLNFLPAPIQMSAAIAAYDRVVQILALKMRRLWLDYFRTTADPSNPKYSVENAGVRALRGLAMKTLAIFEDEPFRKTLFTAHEQANCMTVRMNALNALNQRPDQYREQALANFLEKFQSQPLAVDKWFALQAREENAGALERMEKLAEHPSFDIHNPNRFRSLIAVLMQSNPSVFHAEDGSGYRFAGRQIKRILLLNPQLAAGMLKGFSLVSQMDEKRKAIVREVLAELDAVEGSSVDVREVIERLQRGLS